MKDFIQGEFWKDVVGFEGIYQVSNLGRVYSLPREGKKFGYRNGRVLKQGISSKYCRITLSRPNYRKTYPVHRLVAIAFIDNPYNKPFVDHIDGDRMNNKFYNLRWCTRRENLNFENVKRKGYTNTGMKGIFKKTKSYYYTIFYNYKRIRSIEYPTLEETKIAYDKHLDDLNKKELLLFSKSI